jgi:hypothetical protein
MGTAGIRAPRAPGQWPDLSDVITRGAPKGARSVTREARFPIGFSFGASARSQGFCYKYARTRGGVLC